MDRFEICKGCSNLVKGTLAGYDYVACSANIDYPEKCVNNKYKVLPQANYYDPYARKIYEELFKRKEEDLTEEQRHFVHSMYHMEEVYCGLDGD